MLFTPNQYDCSQLLVLDPEKRLTACLALSHPWLTAAGDLTKMRRITKYNHKMEANRSKCRHNLGVV